MGASVSRRETQELHRPSGNIYQSSCWDSKAVRNLIQAKKLAPISQGEDEKLDEEAEECPICFLYYLGGLNRSNCCKKGICTECFLQIKKPNGQTKCPFCQRSGYSVVFRGPLTKEERESEKWELAQVTKAVERMRAEEAERETQRLSGQWKPPRPEDCYQIFQGSPSSPNSVPIPATGTSPPSSESSLSSIASPGSPVMEIPGTPTETESVNNNQGSSSKRNRLDLEHFMFKEVVRLSLQNSNGDEDEAYSSDKEDLDLALAIAMSLQPPVQ